MSYTGTTPKFESVEGDNIKVDGNTISSTNENGDISLVPNGSGKVAVPNTALNDASTSAATTLYVDQSVEMLDTAIQSQITAIESDITAVENGVSSLQTADLAFVKKDGSVSMEGNLSFFNGTSYFKVTNLADPTSPRDAVNKQTLESVAAGLATRPAVKVATTASLGGTYNNGVADDGVGATLNLGPAATLTIDGVSAWSQFDGILVKDQASSLQNGRYFISQIGNASTNWILTRCGTCDQSSEMPGSYMFVQFGTANQGKGFVAIVGVALGPNSGSFDIGYDSITFTQFSGGTSYTAGSGLQLINTEFSAKVDSSSIGVNGSGQLTTLVKPSVSVAALNIDWSLGELFYKDLAASSTLTFSNLQDGKTISVAIRNTSGADIAITLPTVIKSASFVNTVKASNKETVFTFMRLNGKTYAASIGDMN